MRDNHLKANQKRRFKKTTDSDHGGPVAANLRDQNFACNGPDQKWGVDISYVWTAEGWLYLAIVLDLFSRRIVSWATSDRLKRQLALEALHRAIMIRQPPPGLLHHSEREVVAGFGSYDMPLASASTGTLRGRILGNGDGEVEIDLAADSVGAATVAAHEAAGVIVRPHIDAAAAESTVEGETRVYQTMPIRAFLVSATDARSGWPAPVLTATPEERASASAPRLRGCRDGCDDHRCRAGPKLSASIRRPRRGCWRSPRRRSRGMRRAHRRRFREKRPLDSQGGSPRPPRPAPGARIRATSRPRSPLR